MTKLERLLNDIDVFSEYDRHEFVELENPHIEVVTKLAALIDDRWLPKQFLRTDMDGALYVERWLYDKEFIK